MLLISFLELPSHNSTRVNIFPFKITMVFFVTIDTLSLIIFLLWWLFNALSDVLKHSWSLHLQANNKLLPLGCENSKLPPNPTKYPSAAQNGTLLPFICSPLKETSTSLLRGLVDIMDVAGQEEHISWRKRDVVKHCLPRITWSLHP